MSIRIPAHIGEISPYVPGTPIEEAERRSGLRQVVKLASNENPLGPSPRALQAIRDVASGVHRYPDGSGQALRQALADDIGFPATQIVLGNGSTELLEIAAKVFLSAQRGAVVAEPAFIIYRLAVRAMGAPLRLVPLKNERHDLERMAAACDDSTALVYIGNPNNPTGTSVSCSEMEEYLARLPRHVLTIVDEAYSDYVEASDYPSCLEYLKAGHNLVILRTFSKIHGLAGMRIGYAVSSREVAVALDAVRSPFNTSVLAQAAARAALSDAEHVARSRAENSREARYLAGEFRRRGIDFVPTVANFFLVRTRTKGETLYRRLLSLGVIIRPMEPYGYQDAVRVSIGTRAENERFLTTLDQVLQGGDEAGPGGRSAS
ncbi:MAG TPA: histidinol-phosphate transaminase [Candidatus Polarisedimenticolia bacterium]|nr:histidinol-phosphate transaminase [Candidatus Polarisedimenticolia bacterium]